MVELEINFSKKFIKLNFNAFIELRSNFCYVKISKRTKIHFLVFSLHFC